MRPSNPLIASFLSVLALVACGPDAGTRPQDMSATRHREMAAGEEAQTSTHAALYDAHASTDTEHCSGGVARTATVEPCWGSRGNPTAEHLRMAAEHHRLAAEHLAASQSLRDAEAQRCVGVPTADREISPFDRREDITRVDVATEPRVMGRLSVASPVGIAVTFRAVPGLTAEWLQREIDCHLARNAALGHEVPEMPSCPLVPAGVQARATSTGDGFLVTVRSDDPHVVAELERRGRLLPAAAY